MLPSHAGEVTILGGEPIDVGRLSHDLMQNRLFLKRSGNRARDSLITCKRLSIELAARILRDSGRTLDLQDHAPVHSLECIKPVLIVSINGVPVRLLDGAARIVQAREENRRSVRAILMDKALLSGYFGDQSLNSSSGSEDGGNSIDLSRLVELNTRIGRRIETPTRKQTRSESALGPVKVPRQMLVDGNSVRPGKAIIASLSRKFESGPKTKGNRAPTKLQKVLRDAIDREIVKLLKLRPGNTAAMPVSRYLAGYLGKPDLSGKMHGDDIVAREKLSEFGPAIADGLKFLGDIRGLIELPLVKKFNLDLRAGRFAADKILSPEDFGRLERAEAFVLAGLGHFSDGLARLARASRAVVRDMARVKEVRFDESNPRNPANETYKRIQSMSYGRGEGEGNITGLEAPHLLVPATFASGINPASIWGTLTTHRWAYDVAVAAGKLDRREDAHLLRPSAENYLAHRGLALMGGSNQYSRVWTHIESYLLLIGSGRTFPMQCLIGASYDIDLQLMTDESFGNEWRSGRLQEKISARLDMCRLNDAMIELAARV